MAGTTPEQDAFIASELKAIEFKVPVNAWELCEFIGKNGKGGLPMAWMQWWKEQCTKDPKCKVINRDAIALLKDHIDALEIAGGIFGRSMMGVALPTPQERATLDRERLRAAGLFLG